MWKTMLAGAAAVAIVGCSAVYAQDRAAPVPGARDVPHQQPTAEDISAFTDARVAALRAGLKLTPAQEKNWPAFEQAYRDLAKVRADQMRAFREQRQTDQAGQDDYVSRMQRRADALIARGNALKSFGAAAAPLYQSLDEAQKHRFAALSRAMGPRHHHRFAAWHEQRGASEQR